MADAYQTRKLGLAETAGLLHMKPKDVHYNAQIGQLQATQHGPQGRMLFTRQAVEGYASGHGIKLSSGRGKTFNVSDAAGKIGVTPEQLIIDARAGNVAYMGVSPSSKDVRFTTTDLINYSRSRRGNQEPL